jgi:hypothetical protein
MNAPARPTETITCPAAAPVGSSTTSTNASSHIFHGSPAPVRRVRIATGVIGAAVAAIALTPAPAQAQIDPPAAITRQVVEYTCPLVSDDTVPPADPNPGALVAEGGYVYFVTRTGELRLVRLTPSTAPVCNWWDLDALTVTTGGLRFKASASQAFIRGVTDLQRVNTMTNVRTRWVDGMTSLSDVAIQNGTTTHVYTTGVVGCPTPTNPASCAALGGSVQRFTVNGSTTGTVTRWAVGGGAGLVQYSGIDVHPTYSNLVYFSEPAANNISELNTSTNAVRRWNLTALGVAGPRQLDVDATGFVWVGTASGQLVRLNPRAAADNVHVAEVPLSFLSSVVGIDADGMVGYTTSDDLSKVGLFSPELGLAFTVVPSGPVTVPPSPYNQNLPATASATVTQFTGSALRVPKTVVAEESPDLFGNGDFIEAILPSGLANDSADCGVVSPTVFPEDPCTPSASPQGIANDPKKAGAYFAAVGSSVLRVAHVSLLPTIDFAGGGAVVGSGKMELTDPLTTLPAGTGYFTAWAYKTSQTQPAKGALIYTAPDGKVESLQITGLSFSGSTATITGLCKSGSSCTTFQMKGTDGGWQASQDVFKIIKDPVLGLGFEKGGNLASGGVRLYRW